MIDTTEGESTKDIEEFKILFNEYVKEVKRYMALPWYLRIFYKRPGKIPEWSTYKTERE